MNTCWAKPATLYLHFAVMVHEMGATVGRDSRFVIPGFGDSRKSLAAASLSELGVSMAVEMCRWMATWVFEVLSTSSSRDQVIRHGSNASSANPMLAELASTEPGYFFSLAEAVVPAPPFFLYCLADVVPAVPFVQYFV